MDFKYAFCSAKASLSFVGIGSQMRIDEEETSFGPAAKVLTGNIAIFTSKLTLTAPAMIFLANIVKKIGIRRHFG